MTNSFDRTAAIDPRTLHLAYSPDADDAFMFRAAFDGLVDCEGLEFAPVTANTQELNDRASGRGPDVSAVSVAAYPGIAEDYVLLPHGGSIGRGYGPVIVAKTTCTLDDLKAARIATPGPTTTAHLVSRLMLPEAEITTVPIAPYEAIFEAIESGQVEAGIIIHEGRLTYERRGLAKVADLGVWWMEKTGLPLPLGANVIRRDLGSAVISRASRVLGRSIAWALENRVEMIDWIIAHGERPGEVNDPELIDRYLQMYANDDTRAYRPDTKEGIARLLLEGERIGLFAPGTEPTYA